MQFNRNLFSNILLTLLATVYYLPFVNKGLIIFDEGYIIHFAERIAQGQVPYYDFFIQYTPGFFYILAFCFKIFGTSILVERIVTVIIAGGIVLLTLFLLDEMRLKSFRFKLTAIVTLISFGFPLFNIPIVVWPCILLTVAMMLLFVKWSNSSFLQWKYALSLGILLAVMVFMKQNLGLVYLVLLNILIILSHFKKRAMKLKSITIINSVFLLLSIPWIYYFFLQNGFLSTFLAFNKLFFAIYPFSYPPLSYLFQPLGLFKLLPYYLPILFLLLLCYAYIFKKWEKTYILIAILPLAGFSVTIVPASDLLHVYPFLGITLVMFLAFLQSAKLRFRIIYSLLIALTVISGFYLTLRREQYRYGLPYRLDTTLLDLPKTKGIVIDPNTAKQYTLLNQYIASHTKKEDYIFVYPFSPMLYFIFDRQNPTRYGNTLPGYLTENEERQIIESIKKKKVSFIIVSGKYKFPTLLSKWIQQHTAIAQNSDIGIQILKIKNE